MSENGFWAMPTARANLRCLGYSATIAIAALALTACKHDVPDAQTVQMQNVLQPDEADKEQAALELLRLGYERWVIACGFQTGKHGGTVADAEKNCRVDFGLNPASPSPAQEPDAPAALRAHQEGKTEDSNDVRR